MSPAKKSPKKTVRKASAGRTQKATAKKKTPMRKTTPKKTAAKKSAAKKTSKKTPARKSTAKKTTQRKTTAKTRAVRAPAPSRPPRPAKLDKKALSQIRKTLEDQRNDLLRQQAELEENSFDSTQSDLSGEMGFDEDFADAGTATFDRERDLSIRNNIQDLVDQIGRAIRRIDEGTYGTCERCGRPIDPARLKALPHALLCMDCKRREERAR